MSRRLLVTHLSDTVAEDKMGQQVSETCKAACGIVFEDIVFNDMSRFKTSMEVSGTQDTYKYFRLDGKEIKSLKLKEKNLDLFVSARTDKGMLQGLYFAQSVYFPENSKWNRKTNEQRYVSKGNRKADLYMTIPNDKLEEDAEFHLTMVVNARPRIVMGADGKTVPDEKKTKVELLISTVKSRKQIILEFALPALDQHMRDSQNSSSFFFPGTTEESLGDEKKIDEKKDVKTEEKKKGIERDQGVRTLQKIYFPPELPWEHWELGLVFGKDTAIVEEAMGMSNDVRPGWRVIKVNDFEVTNSTFSKVWAEIQKSTEIAKEVPRLEEKDEKDDHRGV
ncbi:hypothetical protein AAMO2058_001529900 [Amorphochlora amoebiformis]